MDQRSADISIPGYELVRRIGSGGAGVVYEAIQLSIGRAVALKVLHSGRVDAQTERRFRAECQAFGRLSGNPHVVSIHDAGRTDSGELYLVMELVRGGSLGQRVDAEGALEPDEVIRIGLEACRALQAAHGVGIVHRDIKPDNLLVGDDGGTLLADFGIATLSDVTASATGSFAGTIVYSAPETVRGAKAGPMADIYSLGATLFTLASGRPPFAAGPDDSPVTMIWRVGSEAPRPLPAAVPEPLAEVIESAMSKEAEDRPASAAELAARLRGARALIADAQPTPPPVRPGPPPEPDRTPPPTPRPPPPAPPEDVTPLPTPAPPPDPEPGPDERSTRDGEGSERTSHAGPPGLRFLGPDHPDRDDPAPPDRGDLERATGRSRVGDIVLVAVILALVAALAVAALTGDESTAGAGPSTSAAVTGADATTTGSSEASPPTTLRPPAEITTIVLNGTDSVGAAGAASDQLSAEGFGVLAADLALADAARTTLHAPPELEAEARAIAALLGVPDAPVVPRREDPLSRSGRDAEADIIVILGDDIG